MIRNVKSIIVIPAGHHGAVMKRGALLSNDDQRMLTSIKEMIRKNGKKIIYDFDYKIVGQMCGDEILEETRKPK
jgi:hypothetical protein